MPDDLYPVPDDLGLGATVRGFIEGQRLFDRYVLQRILGRGGMGVVWLAHDEQLDRDVALKFLPELITLDLEAIADLKRETRRSLELTHPHIVRIYDFVQDPSWAGISMEFVDGATLSALKVGQPNGCLEVAHLRPWARQVIEALDYAHTRAKVVHRDLKPANLMVNQAGDLKVADFGISKSLSDSATRVTLRGGTSGTLVYMSPQQASGHAVTVSDDIYSLGATFYDLLAGKPPFYSGNIQHQLESITPPTMTQRREELGREGAPIPPEWEETIAACLEKNPADRPASVVEIAERLGLNGNPPAVVRSKTKPPAPTSSPAPRSPTSKPLLIGAAVVALLLLGGLGYYFGVYAPAEQAREAEIAKQQALEQEKEAEAKAAADAAAKQAAAEAEAEKEKQAQAAAAAAAEAQRLANARGGMLVKTDPEGASVTLGGTDVQTSPATFKDEKLGSYPIHITLDGYEPVDQTAEIKENQFTDLGTISLIHSKGTAQITSDPPGLDYTISQNGATITSGKTPAAVPDLPTGTYNVSVTKGSWVDNGTMTVKRNETTSYVPEFATGSLAITSTPPGATVLQGDKSLGQTPLTLSDLQPGAVNYKLKLQGYKTASLSGAVVAKQQTNLDSTLEKMGASAFVGKWDLLWAGNTSGQTIEPSGSNQANMGENVTDCDFKTTTYEISMDESGNPKIEYAFNYTAIVNQARGTSEYSSGSTAELTYNVRIPSGGEMTMHFSNQTGPTKASDTSTQFEYQVNTCRYLPEYNVIEWSYTTIVTSSGGGAPVSVPTTSYFALDPTGEKLSVLTKDDLSKIKDGYYVPPEHSVVQPTMTNQYGTYIYRNTVASYAKRAQ